VSLPRTHGTGNYDVTSLLEKLAAGKLGYLLFGDALQGIVVELVEGLYLRELRLLEAPFGRTLLPGERLGVQ
jgi:hypothetical protein